MCSSDLALAELEGGTVSSPRAALEAFAATLPGAGWADVLARLSQARETRLLPPGAALEAVPRLIALAAELRRRFDALG